MNENLFCAYRGDYVLFLLHFLFRFTFTTFTFASTYHTPTHTILLLIEADIFNSPCSEGVGIRVQFRASTPFSLMYAHSTLKPHFLLFCNVAHTCARETISMKKRTSFIIIPKRKEIFGDDQWYGKVLYQKLRKSVIPLDLIGAL